MENSLYIAAQVHASVKAFLIQLGISPNLIPSVDVGILPPDWKPEPERVLPATTRFRLTKKEKYELDQLRDWQLKRRAGSTAPFVIES